MANFPGEGELRFLYTTVASGVTRSHSHRINVQLTDWETAGQNFSAYDVNVKSGAPIVLQTWVTTYFTYMDDMFHTSATFPTVELWRYTPGTYEAIFWSSYALAGVGAGASAANVDGQNIITFRAAAGGSARLVYMEGIAVPGISQTFPTANAAVNALATYVTSAASAIMARDNSYLISPIRYLPGSNERLTKDRLRP